MQQSRYYPLWIVTDSNRNYNSYIVQYVGIYYFGKENFFKLIGHYKDVGNRKNLQKVLLHEELSLIFERNTVEGEGTLLNYVFLYEM